MKKLFLLSFILLAMTSHAQYVIKPVFKARSFDEYVAPLMMYKQAYDQAVAQFEEYFVKAQNAIEKENYALAKTYLNQCERINNRFEGNICSKKDLAQWIAYCDEQIKRQQNSATRQPSY